MSIIAIEKKERNGYYEKDKTRFKRKRNRIDEANHDRMQKHG